MTTQERYEFCKELVDGFVSAMPKKPTTTTRAEVINQLLNSQYSYMFVDLTPEHIIKLLCISERDYKNVTRHAIRKLKAFSTHEHTKDIRELAIEIEELLYTDMTDNNNKD